MNSPTADRIRQLRRIVALYARAGTPGEKNAAAAAFRRRKVGTPYSEYSVDEFLALGDATPLRLWPRRPTRTRPPAPTPEQREAAQRAAEIHRQENEARRRESEEFEARLRAILQQVADGLAAQHARYMAAERARIAAAQARRERLRQRPRDTNGRFCPCPK
jgi:hypothetical protein